MPKIARPVKDHGPHPTDVHVGRRLRQQRSLLGMSQEKLGEAVELTFQQIQKYERGANRISASRLHQFATVLKIPVTFFFEGLDGEPETPPAADDKMCKRETLELVRAYYNISSPNMRKRLLDLTRSIADESERPRRPAPVPHQERLANSLGG